MKTLHPSIAHFKPLFDFGHLPPHLQEISARFAALAETVMERCEGPEAAAGLRKLLEAKDCAVRALVLKNLPPTKGVVPAGPQGDCG